MEFGRVSEYDSWWNLLPFAAKFIHFKGKIAAKTDEKSHKKTKSRKGDEQPGEK